MGRAFDLYSQAVEDEKKKKTKVVIPSTYSSDATKSGLVSPGRAVELLGIKPATPSKKAKAEVQPTTTPSPKKKDTGFLDTIKEKAKGAVKTLDTFLFGDKQKEKIISPVPLTPEDRLRQKPTEIKMSDDDYVKAVVSVEKLRKDTADRLAQAEKEFAVAKAGGNKSIFKASTKKEIDAMWKQGDTGNQIVELQKQLKMYDQFLGDEPINRGFLGALWAGIKSPGETFIPFGKDVKDLDKLARLHNALEDQKAGAELSGQQKEMINTFRAEAINQMIDKGLGYKVGEVVINLPQYALAFGLTSPLFEAPKKAVVEGLTKAGIKAASQEIVEVGVKQGVKQYGIKAVASNLAPEIAKSLVGYSVGSLAQTGAFVPTIANKTAEYMLPKQELIVGQKGDSIVKDLGGGDSFEKALKKAYLNVLVETASERTGAIVQEPFDLFMKATLGKFALMRGIKTSAELAAIAKQVGWNGIVGEVFEEEIGEIFQAPIEERKYYAPLATPQGTERLLVETLGIAAFGGISGVTDLAISNSTENKKKQGEDIIDIPVRKATAEEVQQATDQESTGENLPPAIKDALGVSGEQSTVPAGRAVQLVQESTKEKIPTFNQAYEKIQSDGGFARIDDQPLAQKNAYAAQELYQGLGLNKEFIYKMATQNKIDLIPELKAFDKLRGEDGDTAQFAVDLMQKLSPDTQAPSSEDSSNVSQKEPPKTEPTKDGNRLNATEVGSVSRANIEKGIDSLGAQLEPIKTAQDVTEALSGKQGKIVNGELTVYRVVPKGASIGKGDLVFDNISDARDFLENYGIKRGQTEIVSAKAKLGDLARFKNSEGKTAKGELIYLKSQSTKSNNQEQQPTEGSSNAQVTLRPRSFSGQKVSVDLVAEWDAAVDVWNGEDGVSLDDQMASQKTIRNIAQQMLSEAQYEKNKYSPDKLVELTQKEISKFEAGKRTAPSGFASTEMDVDKVFSDNKVNTIQRIELPEMVSLARELSGSVPEVRKKLGNALGRFYSGTGKIRLRADIFANPNGAAQVLAHEIGHLADWLPDKNLSRGNLLGRIGSLHNFLRGTFSNPETEAKIDKLIDQRSLLQTARKELERNEEGKVIEKAQDIKYLQKIKALNREIKGLQVNSIKNTVVADELKKMTKLWNDYDDTVDTPYVQYRQSSKELYADAISVLINDPDLLKKTAPTFWREFFVNLDRKPEVKQNFFKIYDLLARGEDVLLSERDKLIGDAFQKGEDLYKLKREENAKRQTDYTFMVKYEFIDKNQAVIDKIAQAQKEGKVIPADDNPQFWLEDYNYVGGVLKNFLETKIQPVYMEMNNKGVQWSDFGKFLFLERVIKERGEFANPMGFTPETAQKQIDFMKKNMTAEQWTAMTTQVGVYREAIKSTLDIAEQSGIYSKDIVAELKANPAYATFQVLDYLDQYIPSSIKKQVGTLKDIANPADATILKTLSVLKAAEKNMVKQKIMAFMQKNFADEVQEAKARYNGRFAEYLEPRDFGKGLFTVMENGQLKGYYVDEYIAKTMDNISIGHTNAMIRFFSFFNSKLFRPLFITFNTGFQTFNLFRDFFRYWKNTPSLLPTQALKQYAQALPRAYNRAFDIPDAVIQQMESEKMLSVTYNDILKGATEEETELEYLMRRYGLDEDTKEAKTRAQKLMKPFTSVLDLIERTGNMIETIPKVAGYFEFQDKMAPAEMRSYVRTSIGSPDFLRKGAAYAYYNNIFLFSNAIKEGLRSDLAVATNPRSAGGWWMKTFLLNFLPKMMVLAALQGLFGDKLREMLSKASEYDRTNYNLVPLGMDVNGKVIYMRIPQDETGRFLGAIFYKAISFYRKDQSVMQSLADVVSTMGGQIPTITPIFDIGSGLFTFAQGRNPYDSFRGRNVLTDEQFKAGGKEALIPFTQWLLDKSGAGVIMKTTTYEKAPTSDTMLEKTLALPILSNVIGRWIRVTDYGAKESLQMTQRKLESEQARQNIQERRTILNEAKDFKKNGGNKGEVEWALVKEIIGHPPKNSDERRQATNIKKKFNVYLQRGESPYFDQYFASSTVDEKMIVFDEMARVKSRKEYLEDVRILRTQGLMSDEVFKGVMKRAPK